MTYFNFFIKICKKALLSELTFYIILDIYINNTKPILILHIDNM